MHGAGGWSTIRGAVRRDGTRLKTAFMSGTRPAPGKLAAPPSGRLGGRLHSWAAPSAHPCPRPRDAPESLWSRERSRWLRSPSSSPARSVPGGRLSERVLAQPFNGQRTAAGAGTPCSVARPSTDLDGPRPRELRHIRDCILASPGRARAADPSFHCIGIDDRNDHLDWLIAPAADRRSWIDITVVDTNTADSPQRRRRRKTDWRAHFAAVRKRDRRRTAELSVRLRQVRSGIETAPRMLPVGRPTLAFLVTLNGRRLGRVGVGDPGTLSVTVFARRHLGRENVRLVVHAGESLGRSSWRWLHWKWNYRRLKVGDRVRIQIVAPRRLDIPHGREVKNYEPTRAGEIRAALRRLGNYRYGWEAAQMLKYERRRPSPRRYPTGSKLKIS